MSCPLCHVRVSHPCPHVRVSHPCPCVLPVSVSVCPPLVPTLCPPPPLHSPGWGDSDRVWHVSPVSPRARGFVTRAGGATVPLWGYKTPGWPQEPPCPRHCHPARAPPVTAATSMVSVGTGRGVRGSPRAGGDPRKGQSPWGPVGSLERGECPFGWVWGCLGWDSGTPPLGTLGGVCGTEMSPWGIGGGPGGEGAPRVGLGVPGGG